MITTGELGSIFAAIFGALHTLASMVIFRINDSPITMYSIMAANFAFMVLGFLIRALFMEPVMREFEGQGRRQFKESYGQHFRTRREKAIAEKKRYKSPAERARNIRKQAYKQWRDMGIRRRWAA